MLSRLRTHLAARIDLASAVAGAAILGAVVFGLNYGHGAGSAAIAALKQATYTFFAAGFIAKNNERLACRRVAPVPSLLVAVIVSSAIAIGLTFIVHSLKGTPEPALSTLPTALIGPPGFLALGWRARRAKLANP